MTNDVKHFSWAYLSSVFFPFFFGEMCLIFHALLNLFSFLFWVAKVFIYSWYKSFVRFSFCNYFLSVTWLSILTVFFDEQKLSISMQFNSLIFPLTACTFYIIYKKYLSNLLRVLFFLLKVLEFYFLYLGLWFIGFYFLVWSKGWGFFFLNFMGAFFFAYGPLIVTVSFTKLFSHFIFLATLLKIDQMCGSISIFSIF